MTAEEALELATCRYVDFPGIRVVDLDAPELPSNDEEMLEVARERMFAEPSHLETIASVSWVLHQYERTGGFAPPAASEAAEEVPEESAAGTESVAVVSARRRPVRARRRPSPSQQRQPNPRPPPQRLV
jgi:hypothetical protein